MTLKKTVETLTHTAVSTAVTAARHPIGAAAKATGLVKDTAGLGLGLVRDRVGGATTSAPGRDHTVAEDVSERVEDVVAEVKDAAAIVKDKVETAAPVKEPESVEKPVAEQTREQAPAAEDPRDHLPGPDLAAFPPPAPEDLPEPIVIEAE